MAEIDRTDADALFTEAMRTEILDIVTRDSVALQTIPVMPMSNKKDRMPVIASLPQAEWLTAEGEAKPTSDITWDNVYITAEELAVIVPVDDTVLADAQIDVASVMTKLVAQAFATKIDKAVYFGEDAPASFPVGGINAAVPVTHTFEYVDPTSFGLLFDPIESLGKTVSDIWATRAINTFLRNPLVENLAAPLQGLSTEGIYGVDLSYPLGWQKDQAMAISADDSCLKIGLRQDLTFDWSNEAYIEGFGSLWQRDHTALRAVMRLGFVIADPINVETEDRTLPLAKLTAPAAGYPFGGNFAGQFNKGQN